MTKMTIPVVNPFSSYLKLLVLRVSLSVPEDAPTGVETKVMNNTVRVRWNKAQNIRGLLLGYKVLLTTSQQLLHLSSGIQRNLCCFFPAFGQRHTFLSCRSF